MNLSQIKYSVGLYFYSSHDFTVLNSRLPRLYMIAREYIQKNKTCEKRCSSLPQIRISKEQIQELRIREELIFC